MTCLPQPPQLPLLTQGLGPASAAIFSAASPTFPSFTGLETPEEGAPHPLAPRLAPALSAHPPWALIGLWGKRCFMALGAQDTGPLPPPRLPEGPVSSQVPFWPL